jgi:hypothetical protein
LTKSLSASQGRTTDRRIGAFRGAACLVTCLAAVLAGSATATTGAGYTLLVKGIMSNSSFVLVHSRVKGGSYVSSNGTVATFQRGTRVIFRFSNDGSKPYLPAIKVLLGPYMPRVVSPADRGKVYTLSAQRAAPPGGKVDFAVTFLYRGEYRLLQLLDKQPHGKPIVINIT